MTLIQTKKICRIPVILFDKGFWQPLINWIENRLYKADKAIDKEDMNIYYLVDNANEAINLVKKLIKKGKIVTEERPVEYSEDQKIQK